MGHDLAKDLSKTAGFSGNQSDLNELLKLIKVAGATDVILVPTSKNISQLIAAEEVVSEFRWIFNINWQIQSTWYSLIIWCIYIIVLKVLKILGEYFDWSRANSTWASGAKRPNN